MRRHTFRHRLLTLLQCLDHQFYQHCAIECGIPIHGHLLRLHGRFMRLYAFQHDSQPASRKYNTEEPAEEAMETQTNGK